MGVHSHTCLVCHKPTWSQWFHRKTKHQPRITPPHVMVVKILFWNNSNAGFIPDYTSPVKQGAAQVSALRTEARAVRCSICSLQKQTDRSPPAVSLWGVCQLFHWEKLLFSVIPRFKLSWSLLFSKPQDTAVYCWTPGGREPPSAPHVFSTFRLVCPHNLRTWL